MTEQDKKIELINKINYCISEIEHTGFRIRKAELTEVGNLINKIDYFKGQLQSYKNIFLKSFPTCTEEKLNKFIEDNTTWERTIVIEEDRIEQFRARKNTYLTKFLSGNNHE